MSSSLGSLEIRDLEVLCILGELPEERLEPQKIFLSILVWYDFSPFLQGDNIMQAVDYTHICQRATQFAQTAKFHLQETLVIRLAHLLLEEFPLLLRVRVEASKPAAWPQALFCGAVFEAQRN